MEVLVVVVTVVVLVSVLVVDVVVEVVEVVVLVVVANSHAKALRSRAQDLPKTSWLQPAGLRS